MSHSLTVSAQSQRLTETRGIDESHLSQVSPPFRGETGETQPETWTQDEAERLREEVKERLQAQAAEYDARRERTRVLREQLAAARTAGLAARQAARLRRIARKIENTKPEFSVSDLGKEQP